MLFQESSLLIFYQYDPWLSSIGGIQTVINNFIKYSPEDFRVGVIGISSDRETPIGVWQEKLLGGRFLNFLPVALVQDDNTRSLVPTTVKYTAGLFKYRRLIKGAAFMHFHRLEPSLAALGIDAKKTLFIHNDIHQQMFGSDQANSILWRSLPQVYFAMERVLINQFDSILSCNTESLKFYKSKYSYLSSKVEIVRNTVDTDVFSFTDLLEKEAARNSLVKGLGLSPDTQFIFFAGRFHPQKDPLLLIQSIAHLKNEPIHLLLAGAGELESRMKSEVSALGLDKQVTFMGRLNTSEMAKTHKASSAFILTSRYEGLPMVALEALACGTPVITTNCGETPHLLTPSSGVIVFDRDAQAIAQSIRMVLANKQRYSPEECFKSSQPYSAEIVIGEIYNAMRSTMMSKSVNLATFS